MSTSISTHYAPLDLDAKATPNPALAGNPLLGDKEQERSQNLTAQAVPSAAETQQLEQLKARDQEVRTHEQAHQSAAGPYSQGISLQYERGSDGRRYAVEGETGVDTAPVPGDPQATLEKAQTILRAALAPAEPSAQDRRVAGEAQRMMADARASIAAQQQEAVQQKGTPQRAYESVANVKGSLGLDLLA